MLFFLSFSFSSITVNSTALQVLLLVDNESVKNITYSVVTDHLKLFWIGDYENRCVLFFLRDSLLIYTMLYERPIDQSIVRSGNSFIVISFRKSEY